MKKARICAAAAAVSILMSGCADNGQSSSSSSQTDSAAATTAAATEPVTERKPADPAKIKYADSYEFEKLSYGNTEKKEVSILVEAEDADDEAGVSVKNSGEGFSGSGYVDISDNKAFSIKVDIPASQFYKITVRHKAGNHKENPLIIGGNKALDIVSESGDWQEISADGIYLEKGENEITLGEGWSWFSMDSIKIENGSSIGDSIYSNTAATLCNSNASLKAQNLYQYLKAVYGKRILAGQCTDHGRSTETDALYRQFGKYPAIRTFDYIFDSMNACNGKPQGKDTALALEWSSLGGIVAFDWHWHAPIGKVNFYTDKTDFKLSDAVTNEDIAMLPLDKLEELKDQGKISKECLAIVQDIDNISSLMQRLEDADVPVLWRPLHEASGGWFWWGASGPENYIWLWKLMYARMTDYHQLDNLIWVWNAQAADWYPGDEYCDICAIDIYNSPHDYGVSPSKFTEVAGWAKNGKLVAMSECATMPDPDLIIRDNVYWLWFAVWCREYIVENSVPLLTETYTSLEMMEKVYNSDAVITLDELPSFDS